MTRITAPISGVIAAGTSIVCMASMGATAAVSTTGAMAGMGAAATSTTRIPMLTQALQAVGLGALTHLPTIVLQPLLIILLLAAVVAALWQARATHTGQAVALAGVTVLAAAELYVSIYSAVSEGGYWVALTVLLLASGLMPWVGRRRRATPRARPRA